MAKTVYESTGKKLVDEDIDEIILRLLGLEDVYDLDYDEYKSLLKEAMTIGRMNSTKMASSETEKLTDEYKRIKRKEGRFKVKGKKVNTSSFVDEQTKGGTYKPKARSLPGARSSQYRPKTSAQKMFGFGSETTTTEEVSDSTEESGVKSLPQGKIQGSSISKTLASIESTLQSILLTLTNQEKSKDKADESARKNAEKEKKRETEKGNESKILNSLKGVGQKVIEPFKGIFDVILNFFKNILLGALAVKLLKIIQDPGKFFRDLINPVIDFFNGIIEGVYAFTVDPINGLIDTINNALKGLTDIVNNLTPWAGGEKSEYQPIPNIPTPTIPRLEPPEEKEASGMAGGGKVTGDTGEKISGMGPDTQLVALQPGEVVMSKKAVDAYGANNLLAMNAAAGGTNRPSKGIIPGYSGGGIVEYLTGDRSHSGYRADHGGGNYHEHIAFGSTAERDSAMNYLQSKGIHIGSINTGKHAPGSYHYVDRAFDVPLYPNLQKFDLSDDRKGEEAFSAKVRKMLVEGGFTGSGIGDGASASVKPKEQKVPGSGGGSKGRWAPILDLIAEGESDTSGGYDAMNPSRDTKAEGNPITQMTMKEVREMAMKSSGTGAAGRYQIMPAYNGTNVFKKLVQDAGLNYEKDLFSPANQDKMAIHRLEKTRRGNDWLRGEMSDEEFAKQLSFEWAALKNKGGGAYDGDGRNKASIGYGRVIDALGKVKSGAGSSSSSSSGSSSRSTGSTESKPRKPVKMNRHWNETRIGPNKGQGRPGVPPPPRRRRRGKSSDMTSGKGSGSASSATGNSQSVRKAFSAIDTYNPDLLVVKSIYNIVG